MYMFGRQSVGGVLDVASFLGPAFNEALPQARRFVQVTVADIILR